MRPLFHAVLCFLLAGTALAASKPHVITLGKWTSVKWFSGPDESKAVDLKVRALYVDGRMKEFTFGPPHEVTDRLFVVRRVFRVNDSLPQETAGNPRWSWQPGGWLLVDRASGHVSQASLPEFDPEYSSASWYRDYAAYCGVSDDGKKLSAVVAQLGRRKPVLKKPLGEVSGEGIAASDCSEPTWQRQPARVTFVTKQDQKVTYSVRGHGVEVVSDNDEEEGTE